MKKELFFKLLVILVVFFCYSTVYAYDKYEVGDYAYFDPVTNSPCDETNYWTVYNSQNNSNTCFRFIILEPNDTSSKSTLKVMLDHNLGFDTFNNASSVLSSTTANWNRYSGNITLPDEDSIATLMKLGSSRPEIVNGESTSINGGVKVYTLMTNTMYYYNSEKVNYAGYWLSGDYSDSNYGYTITEYGNNRLLSKDSSRGIRPMIVVDKSLLNKSPADTDISNYLSSATELKYRYPSETYGGYTYKQMQGFTVTNSKLVFYSSNNGNSSYGLVISYGGDEYDSLNKIDYGKTGHGNGLTYNSKTNKVYLVNNNELHEYNGDTLQRTKIYNESNGYTHNFNAIGYDKYNNYYIGHSDRRMFILDSNFNIKYSFDCEHLMTSQDLEYNNGYVYYTTFEVGGDEINNQIYHFGKQYSSRIFVYNAKFNSDGTPDENFGRLVKILYIDDIRRGEISGTGELEGISFHDGKAWLGYAAKHYDANYTYKFYKIADSKISIKPTFTASTSESENKTTVTLSSNTELVAPVGWTLNSDKKSIKKDFYDSTDGGTVEVCDTYNNCGKATIPALTLKKQNISFLNEIVYKELKDESITVSATYSGNLPVTYASSDNSIASVDSNGKVTFNKTGTVTISAVVNKDSSHYKCVASYVLQILKSDQNLDFSSTSVNKNTNDSSYTMAVSHDVGDGEVTYTSSDENVAVVDNSGKVTIKGAGTTNIVAIASETSLYKSCSASYSLNVVSNPQSISFDSSSVLKKLSEREISVSAKQSTGDGEITYSSSDENVATIDSNGSIKLKGVGQTIITATAQATSNYGSTSACFALNVDRGIQTIKIEDGSIKTLEKTLGISPFKLNVFLDGDGQLSYSSNEESVATISNDGIINVLDAGKSKITVVAMETDNYITSATSIELKVIAEDIINGVPDTANNNKYKLIYLLVSIVVIIAGSLTIFMILRKKRI